ncbi:MAG: urease accessory protein UreF [Sulfitobacter sp.]|nr:urease accessory protein UreF [Sulfitobacter sp.]
MSIDPKLLTLTQWLSPAYPTGAFAFSHGIEQAIQDGWISDAAELEAWLLNCATFGSLRTDAIWLRLAHDAGDVSTIDDEARAYAACQERVLEAERQGIAFVRTTNAVWDLDLPDLLLPIAVGHAVRRANLDPDTATLLFLQASVSNLVSAAMRLMPMGQAAAQGIIAALQPICNATAAEAAKATPDDIHSNTFLSDIAAMRHEILQPRLFQT